MQSTAAPPSTRICGCEPGTGTGTAIAGRATPLIRPIRRSAAAIVAPVLPALTMASALPSRTSSAHTTTDASFFVRTAAGASSIATTSVAGTSSIAVPEPDGQQRRDRVFEADEQDADAELLGGLHRARDDLAGGAVSAHRVDGNGDRHGSRYSTSMT